MHEQPGNGARFGVVNLIDEAKREAFMRRRVYPKQVSAGRMSQEEADRRIDLMEAIVSRLTRTAQVE